MSFCPLEDCSRFWLLRPESQWALRSRILDVWLLMSAQLCCHSLTWCFHHPWEWELCPGNFVRTWLQEVSVAWFRAAVWALLHSLLLLPLSLSAVTTLWHLSVGNIPISGLLLSSNNWMKLFFFLIFINFKYLLALVSLPSNNWEPVNFYFTHIELIFLGASKVRSFNFFMNK